MTIDINELRRDVDDAYVAHVPFEICGSEIIEILDRLEAAEKERNKYKTAYNEWCEKSEWIQEGINNREISPKYLGWHLADIALDLLKEHKEKCDDLQAKVEQMEKQEPAGWQRLYEDGSSTEDIVDSPNVFAHQRPLYLAPGAKGEEK